MNIVNSWFAQDLPSGIRVDALPFKGDDQQLHLADEGVSLADLALPASLKQARLIRRLSFLAGRRCAAHALTLLADTGGADHPHRLLSRLADGRPDWPSGVVGSISHTISLMDGGHEHGRGDVERYQGIALAMVARAEAYRAVAVDIEPLMTAAQAEEVARVISLPAEMVLGQHVGFDPGLWMTLLFSAKETLYKLLYPAVGHFMPFSAAEVTQAETFASEQGSDSGAYRLTLRLTTVWGAYPVDHEVYVQARLVRAAEGAFITSHAYLPQII